MIDKPISNLELINAQKDSESLGKFINGSQTEVVQTRLNEQYPTLANAVYQVMETGGFEPFATETELKASIPAATKKAAKAMDTKKIWYWGGSVWVDTGLSELDQAKADATTKSNQAKADAIAAAAMDATTKSNQAKADAIAAAAMDATTKSNQAKADAIAAAATDATTKSDQAKVDAINYVDGYPTVKSIALTATDNLDNFLVSGRYTALNSAIASIDRGYPVAEAGFLDVQKFGISATVVQTFTTIHGRQYIRRYLSGLWGVWVALATSDSVAAAVSEIMDAALVNRGAVSDSNIASLTDVGLYSVSDMNDFPSDFPSTYGILKRFKFANYAYWELSTTTRPDVFWQKVGAGNWRKISVEDALVPFASKDSLTLNRDKLYPMLALTRSNIASNTNIQSLEKNILDLRVDGAKPDCYYRISYFGNNSSLATEANKFGWVLQEISKTGYGETGGTVKALTASGTTKYEIVPNSGIVQFTLQSTVDSRISFNFTVDTTGFDQSVLYSHSISTAQAWGHIIDPIKYVLRQDIDTAVIDEKISANNKALDALPSTPMITATTAGIAPIDPSGNADFSGLLYAKSVNTAIAPASITKVMSVIVAIESGMELTTLLTTTASDIVAGSGNNLTDGDQITLLDAIYNMMLPSSNTAANLVARSVGMFLGGDTVTFITRMNAKALELDMSSTSFKNPSGLAASGHTSTVSDLLKLGVHASKNATMQSVWGQVSYTLNIQGSNPRSIIIDSSVDPIVAGDPWAIGGKTGTLTPSVYNMLLFVRLRNGYTGVAVTGVSTSDAARYDDIKQIVEYVRNAYAYPAPPQIVLKN